MRLIGLMSGTSVDGIDAALVSLEGAPPNWRWRLEHFLSVPWRPELRAEILAACRPDAPLQRIVALNVLVGEAFAEAARTLAESAQIELSSVDAIASHGQTLWHQPEPFEIAGRAVTGTCQIGEPAVIAARTGCVVVADFRPADMAQGGQGAPLVPFADFALFRSETESRVLQNLGGIANLTYLPAGCSLEQVIAFDTGPGNMLLDALAQRITNGADAYDPEGAFAAQGVLSAPLLESSLARPYFTLPPPKSTGREQFGEAFAEAFYREGLRLGCAEFDLLATATALTAESIARAYRAFLPSLPETVLLGGGGVRNKTLRRMLAERLPSVRFATHAEFGLPDDAKEATAFALLGYETLCRRPSNVPAATGARRPALLGKIVAP